MSDNADRAPKPDNIIEFATHEQRRAQREADDEQAYREAAHAEAISMLERALVMVRERKTSGVVIAIAFDDGCYGYLTPDHAWNAGVTTCGWFSSGKRRRRGKPSSQPSASSREKP